MVDWSCQSCGAHWSEGAYSQDCKECGGGAMERPCFVCNGECGRMWSRAPIDSQDSHEAHWIGSCGMPMTRPKE